MDMFEYFKYLFCVLFLTDVTCSYKHCCRIEVQSLICIGCIPNDVPYNISEVRVFGIEFAKYAGVSNFQGVNWSNVQRLTIIPEVYASGSVVEETHEEFNLKYNTFVNLTNLVSLRFSSVRMTKMERGAFKGLPKLEILDLRDCIYTSLNDITTGIGGSNLSNLRTLILRNISRVKLTSLVSKLGERFFSVLSVTRLEHIVISYVGDFDMDSEMFSSAFPSLQSLNFEHGGNLAVKFLTSCFHYGNGSTFTNLRKINVNFPNIPSAVLNPIHEDKSLFAHNFTELFVRKISPVSLGFSSNLFGMRLNSSVRVRLEFVGTDIKWNLFELLVDDNEAIALKTLDFGENGLEHVDKSISSLAKYLRHLDLSVNRLFKMDEASFEEVLYNKTELEIFNCSYNNLKRIPKNLFKYSKRLNVIDLSHNLIENINFKISHLLDLEILDLSSNKIYFLSNDEINNFQFIFIAKINTKLNINIGNNPFECSCRSKDFVHWLSSVGRDSVFYNEHGFVCYLDKEKEITVNDDAVSEIEYLCIFPYVITSVSVGAGMFVSIVFAITGYCLRRHRERKRKEKLRERIDQFKLDKKLNRNSKKFPVFLSYSSSDVDTVENHLLVALNKNLQRMLETEDHCVVTGDTCFTPGFHVTEEMANCLESCSVLVACISNNFCQSIFCKEELLAANHDKVPIILLFLEKVDVKQLPKSIQRHFRTTTRAKLTVTENDGATFTPDIEKICEGIAMLMSINESSV